MELWLLWLDINLRLGIIILFGIFSKCKDVICAGNIGPALSQISYLDYYLERASVKWADLFGVFSRIVLLFFLALIFCSFILWLIIPVVELRKSARLKQIHEQLAQMQEVIFSIKEHLGRLDDSK